MNKATLSDAAELCICIPGHQKYDYGSRNQLEEKDMEKR